MYMLYVRHKYVYCNFKLCAALQKQNTSITETRTLEEHMKIFFIILNTRRVRVVFCEEQITAYNHSSFFDYKLISQWINIFFLNIRNISFHILLFLEE
jgi:hypothetical protein